MKTKELGINRPATSPCSAFLQVDLLITNRTRLNGACHSMHTQLWRKSKDLTPVRMRLNGARHSVYTKLWRQINTLHLLLEFNEDCFERRELKMS